MNKEIIIYSTPTCYFCHLAKDWFNENGIKFIDHDVQSDVEKRKEMVSLTGQMGVPVIKINDEVIVGFDKDKIEKLLK